MKNILISGLVNTETTCRVRQFPIDYYPIDYPFFGVNTAVSGVAYTLAKAMTTLGDSVRLLSMTGDDFPARYIREDHMILALEDIVRSLSLSLDYICVIDEPLAKRSHIDDLSLQVKQTRYFKQFLFHGLECELKSVQLVPVSACEVWHSYRNVSVLDGYP